MQGKTSKRGSVVSSEEPQPPLTLFARFKDIAIKENMVEDDMHCDVCLGKDWEDDDQIIVCERCFAASH